MFSSVVTLGGLLSSAVLSRRKVFGVITSALGSSSCTNVSGCEFTTNSASARKVADPSSFNFLWCNNAVNASFTDWTIPYATQMGGADGGLKCHSVCLFVNAPAIYMLIAFTSSAISLAAPRKLVPLSL